jgi:hypothetical protein
MIQLPRQEIGLPADSTGIPSGHPKILTTGPLMRFIGVSCRNRAGSVNAGDLPFKNRSGASKERGPFQVEPKMYQENWRYKVGFSKGSQHARK